MLAEISKVIAIISAVNPNFLTFNPMFRVFVTLCKIVNFSRKAKVQFSNSAPVQYFIGFILIFFVVTNGYGQVESEVRPPEGVLPVKADTTNINPDSIIVANDTLPRANDSTKVQAKSKSDIETTINYSARDSIRASFDGKLIWLYGNARIKYGEIELEAEEITIDYGNSTLTAHGIRDSLGNRIGYPIFKNGPELYETKDIVYNFKTKRARISEVVTQQGEAYLHGDIVFFEIEQRIADLVFQVLHSLIFVSEDLFEFLHFLFTFGEAIAQRIVDLSRSFKILLNRKELLLLLRHVAIQLSAIAEKILVIRRELIVLAFEVDELSGRVSQINSKICGVLLQLGQRFV